MRSIVLVACVMFSGCYSVEFKTNTPEPVSGKARPCGCPGKEGCTVCCSPESCMCRQVTVK